MIFGRLGICLGVFFVAQLKINKPLYVAEGGYMGEHNVQCSRTINGKPINMVMEELLGLIKLDDYTLTDNKQPYINTDVLMRKLRNVLGFNLHQEPMALDGGRYVEFVEAAGKLVVNTALKLIICDDNGQQVTTVAKLGSATVAMKKDGSGPVSLEGDIKSAESDSFKRGVFTLCPKPVGYDEKFRSKKEVSEDTGSGKRSNRSSEQLTVSKAFSVLSNGMLSGAVVRNGHTIDAVAYSSEAMAFAAANNTTVDKAAALLLAGAVITASCKEDSYKGVPRVVLNGLGIVKSEPAVAQPPTQQVQEYKGVVKITSTCIKSTDGASVGVEYDGKQAQMHIRYEVLEVIGKMCSITAEQVISILKEGQAYRVRAVVANNGDLLLQEMCKK